MNNIVKIVLIVLGVGLLGIIIFSFMSSSKKPTNTSAEQGGMVMIGENRADVYNNYTIEEWNGFRFKYGGNWQVEKKYNNGQIDSIIIKKDSNETNYIYIGGKDDCSDIGNERCVMAGYGLIIEPIYTNSKEEETLKVFDILVKSITEFQGKCYFDSKLLKEVITNFVQAKIDNNNDKLKNYVSANFFNSHEFSYISEQAKWTRYEIKNNIKFIDSDYQIKIKVYEYYDDKTKEIGSREANFVVVNNDGTYLIDNIKLGSLIKN